LSGLICPESPAEPDDSGLKTQNPRNTRAGVLCRQVTDTPFVSTPQTLLAFDFGLQRTGVAVGNTVSGGARPLTTIAEEENFKRFAAIEALIAEWKPERLLVGLPLAPDGGETEMSKRARRFGNQLHGRFGLPVEFADERYSSAVVEDAFKPSRADKHKIDAAAAAVILQAWLDQQQTSNPIP
jgi:putative Holliday junction resolvase